MQTGRESTRFVTALKAFDERFYTVAERQNQICLDQPFYPMRPGGRRRPQLLAGLGLAWCDLLRRCDRASETRPAACALFWTLGGQQVGKAAITGWRWLLAPALRTGRDLALWPFQGNLDELLARNRFVVTETYPAEFYRHLRLNVKGGKRKQGRVKPTRRRWSHGRRAKGSVSTASWSTKSKMASVPVPVVTTGSTLWSGCSAC